MQKKNAKKNLYASFVQKRGILLENHGNQNFKTFMYSCDIKKRKSAF